MAVRTQNIHANGLGLAAFRNPAQMSFGQWLGAVVWLVGLLTTIIFIRATGIATRISNGIMGDDGGGFWFLELILLVLFALAAQAILTYLESPIWGFHWKYISGWIALAIDSFINMGGTWIIYRGVAKTDSMEALKDITATAQAAAAGGGVKALLIVLALAVMLAALPEVLWRMDAKRALHYGGGYPAPNP
jgi:hypothetical protein